MDHERHSEKFKTSSASQKPRASRKHKRSCHRRGHSDITYEKLRDNIPAERSVFAETKVVVSIHNKLDAVLTVYWVDYTGVERLFSSVPTSHRLTVETHATHTWKVYCRDYNLERTYVVTAHPKQVCVVQIRDDIDPLDESLPETDVQSADSNEEDESEKRVVDPHRCAECNKKLKIVAVHTCRCNQNFCTAHRYAEDHKCSFDYRNDAKEKLHCENPLVKGDGFRGSRL